MFKKLKDKLAEEVKSSPQRFQQFAQAAQAAVTSASSSISDITNNDLFSIGGEETPPHSPESFQNKTVSGSNALNSFQDISLNKSPSPQKDNTMPDEVRGRKLSTSSMASDVSFRLPNYEYPSSLFHLQQSDMDVSASEAEDRCFSSPGPVNLERVNKEQLYAAYKRTQERYNKYRTRYADLARHYRVLERENAKARAVLVETQDKALRRISELREQCTLEQSAKAHLENALRIELDERNLKIEALTTKVQLLQSPEGGNGISTFSKPECTETNIERTPSSNLIDLSTESEKNLEETNTSTIQSLNHKIEKLEELVTKYKESLKNLKEKNTLVVNELQKRTAECDKLVEDNEQLEASVQQLADARQQIQELRESNTILENKVHNQMINRDKQNTALIADLESATNQIQKLEMEIEIFRKREEENAISLAENKLSIHKELENKESEIKLLKESLEKSHKEIKSNELIIGELKEQVKSMQQENKNLCEKLTQSHIIQERNKQLECKLDELNKEISTLESKQTHSLEQYNRLSFQLKQEVDEKLAMIDRNRYLDDKIKITIDENTKKSRQISELERLLADKSNSDQISADESLQQALCELERWKEKYNKLEDEVTEERDELIKLQAEVETMLANYQRMQIENSELQSRIADNEEKTKELIDKKIMVENIFNSVIHYLHDALESIVNGSILQDIDSQLLEKLDKNVHEEIDKIFTQIKNVHKLQINPLSDSENTKLQTQETLRQEVEDLKIKISNLTVINEQLNEKKCQYEAKALQLSEEKDNLIKSWDCAQAQISDLNSELCKYEDLKIAYEELNENKMQSDIIKQKLEDEKSEMQVKADEIVEQVTLLQEEMSELKKSHASIVDEKNNLVSKILEMEQSDKLKLDEVKQLQEANSNSASLLDDIQNLKLERNGLSETYEETKQKLNEAEITIKENNKLIELLHCENRESDNHKMQLSEENNILIEKCEQLKIEKEELHEKVLHFESKIQCRDMRLEELQTENEMFASKLAQFEETVKTISQKETEEMNKFKNILQTVTNEKSQLESELEREKCGREAAQVQLMEAVEQSIKDKETLKEEINKLLATEEMYEIAIKQLTDKITSLENEKIHLHEKLCKLEEKSKQLENMQQIETNFFNLKEEYDSLREDNNRLKADIEGLQTHLTKVTKDNSQLNDKLRELIANEGVIKKIDHALEGTPHEEVETLKEILRKTQDQLHDTERQNSILVEEKLELEDQLKFNNKENGNNNVLIKNDLELELSRLKEKNRELLEDKMLLESKLADLELMGRSGADNVRQLEITNEKLKLSKDKLEQRLDEALVSLRHARALQESTEMEYLRNVLYEYLTGPDSHAFTLAKVLAAVVKFDDQQTKLVLQKEKERQNLLGQLLV